MGLDFDPIDYCRTLLRQPAPYKCPVDKCAKSYKSIYGLQYHLVNCDHAHPNGPPAGPPPPHPTHGHGSGSGGAHSAAAASGPATPTTTNPTSTAASGARKKGGRGGGRGAAGSSAAGRQHGGGGGSSGAGANSQHYASPPKEGLTYLEAQKIVQFDIDGRCIRTNVAEPIALFSAAQITQMIADKECAPFQPRAPPNEAHIKLPEARVRLREDYNICDAPPRPNAYIRFIERSAEELDGEVEYDVDEEDTTWLTIMNERRAEQGLSPVSVDTLELLMDRLEKESYFQAAANGQSGAVVDDDAVCCICVDGECQNTNVILFCDMCNLAVHQDCYGVPYIPEGQWLCRRCLQSPSRPVDCVLCPNTGGAFKQTDHNQWAHVVCALWIPEVRFANTVFLEPIDSIENIPAARWRLTCYICKQRGVGACIQCQRSSCYAAFHVTCAQQAGLHMRMDTVQNAPAGAPVVVQKTAYCDAHCPAAIREAAAAAAAAANELGQSPVSAGGAAGDADGEQQRKKSRMKMKLARETLAKKRTSVPLILIPTIPPDRLQEISTMISNVPKKTAFIQRLLAYWTLKRQYRNGVPLLRRLQSHASQGARGIEGSPDAKELQQQLKYWQSLRQDLERARLLCELVRKREKLKAAYIRCKESVVMMELNPLEATMTKLLLAIAARDTADIFGEPVDVREVPDYADVVQQPMDLSTMRVKLSAGVYGTLDHMQADFDLMIRNCLAYNNKDTVFYRAGVRMRDQCGALFRAVRAELEADGVGEAPKTDEALAREIDDEFRDLLRSSASERVLEQLQFLLEKAMRLRLGLVRAKRTKHIRIEMTKVKKVLNKVAAGARGGGGGGGQRRSMSAGAMSDSSQTDGGEQQPRRAAAAANGGESAAMMVDSSAVDGDLVEALKVLVSGSGAGGVAAGGDEHMGTPPCSPMKGLASSASPSGVNRRTAVLFTRKAQAVKKPDTPVKEEAAAVGAAAGSTSAANLSADSKGGATKKTGRTKRNSNRRSVESGDGSAVGAANGQQTGSASSATAAAAAAAAGLLTTAANVRMASGPASASAATAAMPDSFRVYRAQETRDLSDSEGSQQSFTGSTCSSCSGFDDTDASGSDFGSSFGENNMASGTESEIMSSEMDIDQQLPQRPPPASTQQQPTTAGVGAAAATPPPHPPSSMYNAGHQSAPPPATATVASATAPAAAELSRSGCQLEPLQLVWAKCRGYPWYPALIIDPAIPRGFIYNGVPLPAPPADVLALRKEATATGVFLVLFFDAKRTWQWLPANKLELLGLDKQLDGAKLVESRKPADRKAVKKAYQDALHYQSQVSDLDGQGPGAIM